MQQIKLGKVNFGNKIMSLDLSLLPAYSQSNNCDFSHDIIQMERDEELFVRIVLLSNEKGLPVQRGGISTLMDLHENIEKDKYGDRINSVLAGELAELFGYDEFENWKNNAVAAYIRRLPKDLPVWLYWR